MGTHHTLASATARHFHFTRRCRLRSENVPRAPACAAELPGASGEGHEVAEVIDQGEDQVAHGVGVLKAAQGGAVRKGTWRPKSQRSPKRAADDALTPSSVDSISAFPLAVRSL